jgi:hypothetical protein
MKGTLTVHLGVLAGGYELQKMKCEKFEKKIFYLKISIVDYYQFHHHLKKRQVYVEVFV